MVRTITSKAEWINGTDSRDPHLLDRDIPRAEKVPAPSVRKPNVLDHPLGIHALTELRDQHTSGKKLRYYSQQLLVFLALEATRALPTREKLVEATHGSFKGRALTRPVVFISLSRHGLGLSHEIADFIPDLLVGSITLDHASEHRVEPRLHLANAPALHETKVILFDPIVGSGLSAGIALNVLRKSGATDLALISFVMSSVGVQRIQSSAPETTIWTAAIDMEYDPKRGPLPGIGNFSQRLYEGRG